MRSTRHLIGGVVAAAVTAAVLWGPSAILAGITFNGID
jgi:hypothetical protein